MVGVGGYARPTPTIYPIGSEIPGEPEHYQSKRHESTLFLGGIALTTSFAKDSIGIRLWDLGHCSSPGKGPNLYENWSIGIVYDCP
jgi:hypothetical protein